MSEIHQSVSVDIVLLRFECFVVEQELHPRHLLIYSDQRGHQLLKLSELNHRESRNRPDSIGGEGSPDREEAVRMMWQAVRPIQYRLVYRRGQWLQLLTCRGLSSLSPVQHKLAHY